MNNTTELAAQLRALASDDRYAQLDAEERAALQDAADRLDKGQGAVYTIGRLLAPFLGRLTRSRKAPVIDAGPDPDWTVK